MLNIIVQYYNDSDPERQAEIDDAFRRNLECPWVTQLHNLVEPHCGSRVAGTPSEICRESSRWEA